MASRRILTLEGLRDDAGELQAVNGVFRYGNTLTCPIIGYNTAWPQRSGLYRQVAAAVMEAAMHRQSEVNFSAGAAEFKRRRGGVDAIEYSAVYACHLPRRTRSALTALSVLAMRIGVPAMQWFQR